LPGKVKIKGCPRECICILQKFLKKIPKTCKHQELFPLYIIVEDIAAFKKK
jgi:hypothetical protein